LKIIRRLNPLSIYNNNDGGYHTRVYMSTIFLVYNISYISTFYNTPPQAEGEGSTRNLKRKAVNEEVRSGLVKTLAS
jgi:hypothetical protein